MKLATLLEGMARFEKCQFVIATHSPFLLGIQGAKIYDLDTKGVPVRKWTELENVSEYFDFFQARKGEFESSSNVHQSMINEVITFQNIRSCAKSIYQYC